MKHKKLFAVLTLVCFMFTLVPMTAMATTDSGSTPTTLPEIIPDYSWYSTTTASAYTINSVEQLAGLAKLTQGDVVIDENTKLTKTDFANKTVKLTADLTFANNQYWYYNDGTTVYDYRIMDFAGTFDGAVAGSTSNPVETHTIKNMNFLHTAGTNQNVGLFTKVVYGGAVQNLTIDTVTATVGKEVRFGTIAGYLHGNMSNCHTKNIAVTADSGSGVLRAAGMVAYPQGTQGKITVSGCSVDGFNVTEKSTHADATLAFVAGFMGSVSGEVEITDCEAKNVDITGPCFQNVSGFIGRVRNSADKPITISRCTTSVVNLTDGGDAKYVGGFIGDMAYVNITDCILSDLTMTIKGSPDKTGGFIGVIAESNNYALTEKYDVTLNGCKAENITMTLGDDSSDYLQSVGGFIGQQYGHYSKIEGCHIIGLNATLTGYLESSFAGFIGTVARKADITNCSASGVIDATKVIPTTGSNGTYYPGQVGGFIGDVGYNGSGNCTIEKCTAAVNITANGPAGGFVASAWPYCGGGKTGSITITDCTVGVLYDAENNPYEVPVTVKSLSAAAGGFIGVGDRGTFTGCTTNASVSGVTAAGFWGEITPNVSSMENKTLIIDSCETNGIVLGSTVASGFVGTITASGENDSNATSVTIKNSTSAPIVIGTGSGQPVDFASEIVPDGSESHYDASDNNNGASVTVDINAGGSANIDAETGKVVVTNGTIAIGNKEVEVIEGSAVVNSDGSIELAAGSGVIVGDKEITVDNGAAIVNPDGSVDIAEDTNLKVDGEDVSMPNGGSIDADGEVVKTQLDSRISAANVTGEYGETIELSATVAQKARVRTTTESTIAFYYNDTLLGYDTVDVNGGTVTIEYNTKERVLPCGENTVIIEYGGSEDLKTTSSAIKVTLTKKALTVIANDQSVEQGAAMPELIYDVDGLVSGDTFVNPTITVAAADTSTAGEFAINISGGTLTNAGYYAVTYVSGTLTITEKVEEPTPDEPEDEYIPTSSSGGFSGVYNYPVTVTQPSNGTITLSESSAVKGETVIVTATPKNGFGTAKVIVTDSDDDTIAVTDLQNGTYSFVMPEGQVSVTAEFKGAVVLKIGDNKMNVFGKTVVNDVAPQIKGNYTMLPIRPVIEALGGDVAWDPVTQKITVKLNGRTVVMYVGEKVGYINGAATEMDVPSYIDNSRALYQLRFVAEATDTNIYWNKATYEVTLIPE